LHSGATGVIDVITRYEPPQGENHMKTIAEETTTAPAPAAEEQPTKKAATKATRAPRRAPVAPAKGKAGKKTTPAKKAPKSAKQAKRAKADAGARAGSKTAIILDLLKRPGGVSAGALMKATGWQAHSVRGFLSGTVGKKLGLTVVSAKNQDGERTYTVEA
jgi:hypothetical protein